MVIIINREELVLTPMAVCKSVDLIYGRYHVLSNKWLYVCVMFIKKVGSCKYLCKW